MWTVELAPEFEPELRALAAEVRVELLAQARVIERFGPTTGRPRVDTLNGSAHANMKELRFNAGDGVWRVAFAFDPRRRAVLLVAGDKSGQSERAFYRRCGPPQCGASRSVEPRQGTQMIWRHRWLKR